MEQQSAALYTPCIVAYNGDRWILWSMLARRRAAPCPHSHTAVRAGTLFLSLHDCLPCRRKRRLNVLCLARGTFSTSSLVHDTDLPSSLVPLKSGLYPDATPTDSVGFHMYDHPSMSDFASAPKFAAVSFWKFATTPSPTTNAIITVVRTVSISCRALAGKRGAQSSGPKRTQQPYRCPRAHAWLATVATHLRPSLPFARSSARS